jgi:hypothetical protein
MDTRFRVPDQRYNRGWRWTPAGRRAYRKWTALVVFGLILVVLSCDAFSFWIVAAALGGYAWHRKRVNERELLAAQQPEVTPFPVPTGTPPGMYCPPSPVDEQRTRQPIPKDVKRTVWLRDFGRCQGCGISEQEVMMRDGEHLHFDHILPWSMNGADTAANLQLLCGPCNRAKGTSYYAG